MSRALFILFLLFLSVLRLPISLIAIALKPLLPFLNRRILFERKNLLEHSALSFKKENLRADFCFEVSSEGELEQVRPLLERIISEKKRVEILFSSPSVEKKCLALYDRYPDSVRILRMPFVTFWPFPFLYFQSVWSWVSAPTVIFCRYDFFPELLLLKCLEKKFVLLSGAIKKKGWYKLLAFSFFDIVVAATNGEKDQFEDLLGKKAIVFSCDFRIPRIFERLSLADKTLAAKAGLEAYINFIKKIPSSQKIILGSAWESDLSILKDAKLVADVKSSKIHLLVVPHKLDEDFIANLNEKLSIIFGRELVEILKEGEVFKKSPVTLLQMSGVLCELYSLFKVSYVGGGYERSIHSVLEPFFSGSFVITGPKVQRSTEYDLISEMAPKEIHVLIQPDSFYTICEQNFLDKNPDQEVRTFWQKNSASEMNRIIELLLETAK